MGKTFLRKLRVIGNTEYTDLHRFYPTDFIRIKTTVGLNRVESVSAQAIPNRKRNAIILYVSVTA